MLCAEVSREERGLGGRQSRVNGPEVRLAPLHLRNPGPGSGRAATCPSGTAARLPSRGAVPVPSLSQAPLLVWAHLPSNLEPFHFELNEAGEFAVGEEVAIAQGGLRSEGALMS